MKTKNNIIAFVVIGVLGTLMHFVYDWSGQNTIVGLISAINESIWEHQKLLFFPSVAYFAVEYFFCGGKEIKNYIPASVYGIFAGIAFVISAFYVYSGILGYSIDFINILLFFLGVIVTLVVRNLIIKNGGLKGIGAKKIALILLIAVAALFFVFTFYPPKISLFIPNLE